MLTACLKRDRTGESGMSFPLWTYQGRNFGTQEEPGSKGKYEVLYRYPKSSNPSEHFYAATTGYGKGS